MSRGCIEKSATRALSPTGGFLRGFAFSLNPYIGCAFGASGGCPFCYVRTMPVAQTGSGPWGSWVIAKSNLPQLLEKELRTLARSGRLTETTIFMSSATDPYQGYERKLQLSRRALELFERFRPRRVLLQTRSPLVERDLDVLAALGRHVLVSVTIETDDEAVRRTFTPTSASVARRFAAIRRLRDAGIPNQIAIAPMLPNCIERFAGLVSEFADRVVVDTYFEGDGSKGRRSRALGMVELYRRLGYDGWFEPGAEKNLLRALSARMGAERVLFSAEGFRAI